MPRFTPPQYPDLLTVKNWNKNKGIWAKIVASKTGVSELLKVCEKAYDGVQWAKFDFEQLLLKEADPSQKTLDDLQKDAEKELSAAKKLEAAVDKVETLARDVHKEFKANKLIRKSSTEHVKDVADEAKAFSEEMSAKSIKKLSDKQYDLGLEVVKKKKDDNVKAFKEMRKCIDASEGKLKGVKTRADFVKFHQDCLSGVAREFGNLFHVVPSLKDNHKEFLRTCAQNRMPTSDGEVPDRLARIGPLLKSISKKLDDYQKA